MSKPFNFIAVDFDGTCVTHEYPEIGKELPDCVRVLKRLQSNFCAIILNTMRNGEELQFAVNWFAERGIELFSINENPNQKTWTQSPKVYAQIYIDDAALGCPLISPLNGKRDFVDWIAVEQLLEKKGVFLAEKMLAQIPTNTTKTIPENETEKIQRFIQANNIPERKLNLL